MNSANKPGIHGAFWSNIAKLVSGAALSQAFIFITIPILTRLYSPEAFGVAALFTSIVLFLSPISSMGYHQAIVLPESETDANAVCYLSFLVIAVFSLLLFIPFGMFSGEVARFFNAPALSAITWLLPLAIFSRGIYLVLAMDSSRKRTFGLQAVSTVLQTLIDRVIILGAGFLGYVSGTTIIWGRFFASLGETGVFVENLNALRKNRKEIDWDLIKHVSRRYKNFPLFANWVTFFSLGASHLPIYVLSFFFTPEVAGFFALTNRLLKTPMQLCGNALSRVYYQSAANEQNDQEALRSFFFDLRERLIGYGLFPFLVLSVAGEDLFTFVLGTNWAKTGEFAQILCLLVAAQFISAPIAGLVNVLGRQKMFLALTLFLLTTRFIALVIGGVNSDPILSLWLMVLAGVVFYGYLHLWIGVCLNIPKIETLKLLARYVSLNIVCTSVIVIFKWGLIEGIYIIPIILLTAIIYYTLALYFVDKITPFSIFHTLGQRVKRGHTR